ncbi:MAG: hypothetical protein DRO18_06635 [Thermoprotei archaeon]|nr:MAG: hypothetical protein DRO18_06635 [Thermoprotei archaeon]
MRADVRGEEHFLRSSTKGAVSLGIASRGAVMAAMRSSATRVATTGIRTLSLMTSRPPQPRLGEGEEDLIPEGCQLLDSVFFDEAV